MNGIRKISNGLLGLSLILGLVTTLAGPASAQALFSEDFEGGLSRWVGQQGGEHHGVIVEDPLRPGNHVLTFTAVYAFGNIFSELITAPPGSSLMLEFDYLGDPTAGGEPGNLGGVIGISDGLPDGHRWLAGTSTSGGIEQDLLVDDGAWHHYAIPFDPYQAAGCCGYNGSGSFHIMLEDFWEQSIPGDAYFDNITIAVAGARQQVNIDIKPGGFPNSINPRSKGVIPVAILNTATFDATTIDPTTVRFGATGSEAAPAKFALEDVDGDGDTDMLLHFKTRDTGIVCNDSAAALSGETFSGLAVEGSDSIKTVRCKAGSSPGSVMPVIADTRRLERTR